MATGGIEIVRLTGGEASAAIPDLSRLRCEVFRAWPYLYEGTAQSEADYLGAFIEADDAIIIAAREGDAIIGAATASPLMSHTPEFGPLFAAHGIAPDGVFYCGESVLLEDYRGRGIGHAFFDKREAAGRDLGAARGQAFTHFAFCGVIRSDDDPRRPATYRPLDAFWRKRGYQPVAGMVGAYPWREIGDTAETDHPMQFWLRPASADLKPNAG
ncbi:MAG: GNAT family N-acetyltransferase [Pseudomonadota bacterium]